MSNWYSTTSEEAQTRLLGAWPTAPIDQLELCGMILEVAREQVLEYGPELEQVPLAAIASDLASLGYNEAVIDDVLEILDGPEGGPIPVRFVYAQLQQAINLWNAGSVSGDGSLGEGQFSFTPRPLDKTIRGIIRPVDGKPHVL